MALAGNVAFPAQSWRAQQQSGTPTTTLNDPQRLRQRFVRDACGRFVPIDWAEAFDRVATALDLMGARTVRQPSAFSGVAHSPAIASQGMDGGTR
ncbi:MAG: hypothetical protein GEU99_24795 [Luteitalea sp.]|nr:hypothetical protein [Luteitalea sp.]